MRIFVTGGSGFIGSHLIQRLKDHEVLCLSRRPVSESPYDFITWVSGDLENSRMWKSELEKFHPEVCLHLAWDGLPNYSKETSQRNIELSEQLLHNLIEFDVKKIVVAGSCWEYGTVTGELREDILPHPVGDFALAKLGLHQKFQEFCIKSQVELVWTRIFYSYGPGQRETSLLPSLFYALRNGDTPAIKSPDAMQDFIHVADVASALALLATTDAPSGIFNIGSGYPTSVAEFVNIIAICCGSSFRLDTTSAVHGSWASIAKIESSTGWRPTISINQGVTETIRELDRISN